MTLAKRAQDLIRARDDHENLCYKYDEQCANYVRICRGWDSRDKFKIQQEFSHRFPCKTKESKRELQKARTEYLEAQEQAREAGVPEVLLNYVKSVDVCSDDSEEIDRDDFFFGVTRVPRRPVGTRTEVIKRDLYPSCQRLYDWRLDVEPTVPLEDSVVVLNDSSPGRAGSNFNDETHAK